MKIKTSELTGIALDWAVAKCESQTKKNFRLLDRIKIFTSGTVGLFRMPKSTMHSGSWYKPSTDWAQGGPLIEREFIATFSVETCPFEGQWAADRNRHQQLSSDEMGNDQYSFYTTELSYGPTPLIAAMRCYVASNLGTEVEIPEELT